MATNAEIQFNYHQTKFRLPNPSATAAWIRKVVRAESRGVSSLSYVFCTDSYLLQINQDYLAHDTFTDIITFDLSGDAPKNNGTVDGEIYISIPRVRENARALDLPFDEELHRVIIHGVLHLLGYGDKTTRQKSEMRERESAYLSLR